MKVFIVSIRHAFRPCKEGRRHGLKSGGGTKRESRAKRAKKKFVPPTFGKVGVQFFTRAWYEQANNYQY